MSAEQPVPDEIVIAEAESLRPTEDSDNSKPSRPMPEITPEAPANATDAVSQNGGTTNGQPDGQPFTEKDLQHALRNLQENGIGGKADRSPDEAPERKFLAVSGRKLNHSESRFAHELTVSIDKIDGGGWLLGRVCTFKAAEKSRFAVETGPDGQTGQPTLVLLPENKRTRQAVADGRVAIVKPLGTLDRPESGPIIRAGSLQRPYPGEMEQNVRKLRPHWQLRLEPAGKRGKVSSETVAQIVKAEEAEQRKHKTWKILVKTGPVRGSLQSQPNPKRRGMRDYFVEQTIPGLGRVRFLLGNRVSPLLKDGSEVTVEATDKPLSVDEKSAIVHARIPGTRKSRSSLAGAPGNTREPGAKKRGVKAGKQRKKKQQ